MIKFWYIATYFLYEYKFATDFCWYASNESKSTFTLLHIFFKYLIAF